MVEVAPLARQEWVTIGTAADRTSRAITWLVVFATLGIAGTVVGFGSGDEWLPLLGAAVVLLGIVGYLWATGRCPRCGARPLLFRLNLPAACARCGVSFAEPVAHPRAEADVPRSSLETAGDRDGG